MGRIKGFDFARSISAIGIVVYHFYCHSNSPLEIFLNHANGSWGGALNYLFFALGGLVIQLKYGPEENWDIKKFYYKRWKATMPAYYVAFLHTYFMNVFAFGRLFYHNIPHSRILLTLIGMDGYAKWVFQTYHTVGEWFLGAILIAYSVYPLFRWIVNSSRKWMKYIAVVFMLILYAVVLKIDCCGMPTAVNPVVCLLTFFVGMLLATEYQRMKKTGITIAATIGLVILVTIPISGSSVTKAILIGIALLIVLYNLGEVCCRYKPIYAIVKYVSSTSYYIFLLHHLIIYKVLGGFNTPNPVKSLILLMAVICITLVYAKVLDILMKAFLGSKIYSKFERLIVR